MATEEEKRKRRLGIASISPEDQQRFDRTAQAGKSIVQTGKNVVSDISRAFSAAPAVAADYAGSRGSIAETVTERQNPRKPILESAGRPERGFGGMAAMPKRGEAQAATLPQQPVQDIAATQRKRVFEPQEIAKTPKKTSQFGGQFRPVPQRAGAGQMIEWYKDGEVPGYSYAGTPEAEAFNKARDLEFGPLQKKPEEQLKEKYLSAQTPEEKKRVSQDIAAISGQQNTPVTPMQVAKMETDANQAYQNHFSNTTGAMNPTDYLDADMTKPIDKKLWLYKNLGNTAYSLFGPPDERTQALSIINSNPSMWQQYIDADENTRESLLQRILSGA